MNEKEIIQKNIKEGKLLFLDEILEDNTFFNHIENVRASQQFKSPRR